MIRFTCSGCQKHLKAPEDKAGTTVDCPRCRKPVRIPAASTREQNVIASVLPENPVTASLPSAPLSLTILSQLQDHTIHEPEKTSGPACPIFDPIVDARIAEQAQRTRHQKSRSGYGLVVGILVVAAIAIAILAYQSFPKSRSSEVSISYEARISYDGQGTRRIEEKMKVSEASGDWMVISGAVVGLAIVALVARLHFRKNQRPGVD
jgi:hypothetical protein